MKTIITRTMSCGLAIAGLFSGTALADDTELFSQSPSVVGQRPNVLIVLDNSANWNTASQGWPDDLGKQGQSELDALKTVIGALDDKMNVGLMMFTEGSGPKPNGGYVRYAVRQMTETNKLGLQNVLANIVVTGSGSDQVGSAKTDYSAAMFEAYKYFGGYTNPANATTNIAGSPVSPTQYGLGAYSGQYNGKRDYAGNSAVFSGGALPSNAFASSGSVAYQSPITDSCARTYIVFIGNGYPSTDAGPTLLSNVAGNTAQLYVTPKTNYADEWARYLATTDVSSLVGQQRVFTYAIDVFNAKQDMDQTMLLKSMANAGKGAYFATTNKDQLVNAFAKIFNEIQAVNSVFAAVTLPVSLNVRGTNLNQVYLGVFRPDPDARPRWPGNLKQYQLALDSVTNSLVLADSQTPPLKVEDPVAGFIVNGAKSYWTTPSTFWSFSPSGSPSSASDSPDGAVVEKGGVAQMLRTDYAISQSARRVFTCVGCAAGTALSSSSGSATSFADGNGAITQAKLGAADSSERSAIIDWVRGQDNKENENNDFAGGSPIMTDARASVHGDVLHARPAVINYNRYDNDDDVVVFYGANDGMLRAVQGGRGATGGKELWSFIPEEFLGRFKRLRDNSVTIDSANPKPYFFDGSIGVHALDGDNNGALGGVSDQVKLFVSMRRGGRYVYAFDANDPVNPTLLWKKGCPNLNNNIGCDTGYEELGQTWSEPKVAKIHATNNPVLIFGAGYDPAVDDLDPIPAGVVNGKGRGILVVDSTNGNVLWQAGPSPSGTTPNKTVAAMTYSIPADTASVDTNLDGFVDRIYVGDTGGNVWRADIHDTDPALWTVNKFASVGYAATSNTVDRRKFLGQISAVQAKDVNGRYDAIVVGSGDREHPFNGYGDAAHPLSDAVVNRVFMFKDRSTGLSFAASGSGADGAIVAADLLDVTDNKVQQGTAAEQTTAREALAHPNNKGWFITLETGEKVVGNALTAGGSTFFGTNKPNPPMPGVCSNLGIARQYQINYKDGSAAVDQDGVVGLTAVDRYAVHAGGGFVPSPVLIVVQLPNGKVYQTVCSGTGCQAPTTPPIKARIRTFWNKTIDK